MRISVPSHLLFGCLFFLSYHQIGFSQDRYFEPAVPFAAI